MDLLSISDVVQAQDDKIMSIDEKVSQLKLTVEENNSDMHQKIYCIMQAVNQINQKLSTNGNSPPVTPTQVCHQGTSQAVVNPAFEGDRDEYKNERNSENA